MVLISERLYTVTGAQPPQVVFAPCPPTLPPTAALNHMYLRATFSQLGFDDVDNEEGFTSLRVVKALCHSSQDAVVPDTGEPRHGIRFT